MTRAASSGAAGRGREAILLFADKTSQKRRKAPPVMPHICDYCIGYFIGVKQKRFCSKSCTEAACRTRKAALIAALTLEFAAYGMSRANIERCVNADLERCQNIAKVLGLHYIERQRIWSRSEHARLYTA